MLKKVGAKVTRDLSGNTDVLIVGKDVGSKKKLKALSQKEKRPDTFYIFTQEGVAKVLGINLS